MFKRLGGILCLDFMNTVSWHASDHPKDRLKSYHDLLTWSHQAGVLTDRDRQKLLREAARRPHVAEVVLKRAVTFREASYRVILALVRERSPNREDLALLNEALSETLSRSRLVPTSQGLEWNWTEVDPLERMFWPLVRSTADLLTSKQLDKVRKCADDYNGCGWLFIDKSRNHSRRWCDMSDCGNRAKARNHYDRTRELTRSGTQN